MFTRSLLSLHVNSWEGSDYWGPGGNVLVSCQNSRAPNFFVGMGASE